MLYLKHNDSIQTISGRILYSVHKLNNMNWRKSKPMKLTFLGADHEVTGSCHYLCVGDKNVLIDCGMEQGNDVYENQELPIPASEVDYVLLTHAHIDHSGLIPLLYVHGFRGKIYCTEATVQLCDIMLRDSAHIQMFEAEWRNRKAKRSNGTLKEFVPLYDA